ncbi:MAG: hypothetical protein ACRC0G_14300, partial [Fusobacteriaceae bacterium]
FDDIHIRRVLASVIGVPIFGVMPHKVFEISNGFLIRYYQNGKQKDLIVNELTKNANIITACSVKIK